MVDDYDPDKNDFDYRRFMDLVYDGRGSEAFEVFESNPDLVDELKFGEVVNCYEEFLRSGTDSMAKTFYFKLLKKVVYIFSEDISSVHFLQEKFDDVRLENFLNSLSDEAKKNLEELGGG